MTRNNTKTVEVSPYPKLGWYVLVFFQDGESIAQATVPAKNLEKACRKWIEQGKMPSLSVGCFWVTKENLK